jgi:hypothetical protein
MSKDFDKEFEQFMAGASAMAQFGNTMSELYKAMRKENIPAEVAGYIVGISMGYVMNVMFDDLGPEDDTT